MAAFPPALLRVGLCLGRLVDEAIGVMDGLVPGIGISGPDPVGIEVDGPFKAGGLAV